MYSFLVDGHNENPSHCIIVKDLFELNYIALPRKHRFAETNEMIFSTENLQFKIRFLLKSQPVKYCDTRQTVHIRQMKISIYECFSFLAKYFLRIFLLSFLN